MNGDMSKLIENLIVFTVNHFHLKKWNSPIMFLQLEIVTDVKFRRKIYSRYGIPTIKWDGNKINDTFNIYIYINNLNINEEFKKIDVQYLMNGVNKIYRCYMNVKDSSFRVIKIVEIPD